MNFFIFVFNRHCKNYTFTSFFSQTIYDQFQMIYIARMVKCLPAMWEAWVQSLGQDDPLEKEMATHSSILAWKIPWMEEPGGLQSMGWQRVGHD